MTRSVAAGDEVHGRAPRGETDAPVVGRGELLELEQRLAVGLGVDVLVLDEIAEDPHTAGVITT